MNQIYQLMNQNNIVQRFMEFQKAFRGDPRAEVQRLMQSGQMSQEQYNRLQDMARQLQAILNIR